MLHRIVRSKTFWPVLALVLLIAFNCLITEHFSEIRLIEDSMSGKLRLFGPMIDILHRGSRVMLLAIGMTLVIATTGIDLSVGSVMAISGAIAAVLLKQNVLPVYAIVPLALGCATLAGLWNGSLVAFLKLQPIVATLIMLVAGRGIARLITGDQIVVFEVPAFEFIGSGSFLMFSIPLYIVLFILGVTLFITKMTVAGLFIEAVGANETASRYSGLNPALVKLLVYGFSGLCAGMAGLIETADIKAGDVLHCGLCMELDAILAVVIGGTAFSGGRANIIGSIIGALIMQTITTSMLIWGVPVQQTPMIKAVAVIFVCLLQSPHMKLSVTSYQ